MVSPMCRLEHHHHHHQHWLKDVDRCNARYAHTLSRAESLTPAPAIAAVEIHVDALNITLYTCCMGVLALITFILVGSALLCALFSTKAKDFVRTWKTTVKDTWRMALEICEALFNTVSGHAHINRDEGELLSSVTIAMISWKTCLTMLEIQMMFSSASYFGLEQVVVISCHIIIFPQVYRDFKTGILTDYAIYTAELVGFTTLAVIDARITLGVHIVITVVASSFVVFQQCLCTKIIRVSNTTLTVTHHADHEANADPDRIVGGDQDIGFWEIVHPWKYTKCKQVSLSQMMSLRPRRTLFISTPMLFTTNVVGSFMAIWLRDKFLPYWFPDTSLSACYKVNANVHYLKYALGALAVGVRICAILYGTWSGEGLQHAAECMVPTSVWTSVGLFDDGLARTVSRLPAWLIACVTMNLVLVWSMYRALSAREG